MPLQPTPNPTSDPTPNPTPEPTVCYKSVPCNEVQYVQTSNTIPCSAPDSDARNSDGFCVYE